MEKNSMHSEMLKARGRTYFFDLKEAENGNKYLTVTESRKTKDGAFLSNRLMIFQDDLESFRETMNMMLTKAQESVTNG